MYTCIFICIKIFDVDVSKYVYMVRDGWSRREVHGSALKSVLPLQMRIVIWLKVCVNSMYLKLFTVREYVTLLRLTADHILLSSRVTNFDNHACVTHDKSIHMMMTITSVTTILLFFF